MPEPEARAPTTAAPGGRRLVRNTLLNITGEGFPIAVAIVAIPVLVAGLGIERFGVLTLAWIFVGYLGLFDLGLSRTVTKLVAERLGTEREHEIPGVVCSSLVAIFALGTVGGLALAAASPGVIGGALNVPQALRGETQTAFYLLAAALPCVVTLPALRGLLEAQGRFGLVNAVRLPMGVFTYLGPLLVLPVSHDLAAIVAVLIGGRALAWLAYLRLCLRTLPSLRRWSFERGQLGALMRSGGWIAVSNLVSGVMLTLDRFLIGVLLSVGAVAYYTTPYDAMIKLLVVSSALVAVLFPTLAASRNIRATAFLYAKGLRYLLIVLFPIVLVLVASAPALLELWLGAEFAANSADVMRLLAVGVLANSFATVPFILLQARGRADVTAKLQLVEAPFHLGLLWAMTRSFGLEGAAGASLIRMVVGAGLQFLFARRLVPGSAGGLRPLVPFALPAAAALGVVWLAPAPVGVLLTMPALALFAAVAWTRLLTAEERGTLSARLARLAGRVGPAGAARRRAAPREAPPTLAAEDSG